MFINIKKKLIFISLSILTFLVMFSCGDSESIYAYVVDNQTKYNIVLNFIGQDFENKGSILLKPFTETVIEQEYYSSQKKLDCRLLYFYKDNLQFVVDNGNKQLIKDVSDENNWICTGDKKSSLIMIGNYYNNLKSTFTITENNLK